MGRLTSKVSTKAQTVIPLEVRQRLGLQPGDTLSYRYTESGVVIEKLEPLDDDPFATFSEWASAQDDEAYADL